MITPRLKREDEVGGILEEPGSHQDLVKDREHEKGFERLRPSPIGGKAT